MRTIVLIFKTTYECNANCSYCHMIKLGGENIFISIDTVKKSLKRFEEYILSLGLKENEKVLARVIWHGGEPLLLGDEFFKEVSYLFKSSEVLKKYALQFHQVQSNFTLFHKYDFSNLFNLVNGKFNISYDPFTQDRQLKNHKSYKREFLKSMYKLKKLGGKGILTYVVTKNNVDKAKEFYYFIKNFGFLGVEMDPVYGCKDAMSEEEFGNFLCDIWKLWKEDNFAVNLIVFHKWRANLSGLKQTVGSHYGKACIKDSFTITPNGNILGCGKQESEPFGNIYTNSFIEIEPYKQKIVDNRLNYLINSEDECKNCSWWELCYGECPFSTKTPNIKTKNKAIWCESYKKVFTLMQEDLNKFSRSKSVYPDKCTA